MKTKKTMDILCSYHYDYYPLPLPDNEQNSKVDWQTKDNHCLLLAQPNFVGATGNTTNLSPA
jgi:hypothetical protein